MSNTICFQFLSSTVHSGQKTKKRPGRTRRECRAFKQPNFSERERKARTETRERKAEKNKNEVGPQGTGDSNKQRHDPEREREREREREGAWRMQLAFIYQLLTWQNSL